MRIEGTHTHTRNNNRASWCPCQTSNLNSLALTTLSQTHCFWVQYLVINNLLTHFLMLLHLTAIIHLHNRTKDDEQRSKGGCVGCVKEEGREGGATTPLHLRPRPSHSHPTTNTPNTVQSHSNEITTAVLVPTSSSVGSTYGWIQMNCGRI